MLQVYCIFYQKMRLWSSKEGTNEQIANFQNFGWTVLYKTCKELYLVKGGW